MSGWPLKGWWQVGLRLDLSQPALGAAMGPRIGEFLQKGRKAERQRVVRRAWITSKTTSRMIKDPAITEVCTRLDDSGACGPIRRCDADPIEMRPCRLRRLCGYPMPTVGAHHRLPHRERGRDRTR